MINTADFEYGFAQAAQLARVAQCYAKRVDLRHSAYEAGYTLGTLYRLAFEAHDLGVQSSSDIRALCYAAVAQHWAPPLSDAARDRCASFTHEANTVRP